MGYKERLLFCDDHISDHLKRRRDSLYDEELTKHLLNRAFKIDAPMGNHESKFFEELEKTVEGTEEPEPKRKKPRGGIKVKRIKDPRSWLS